MVLIQRRFGNLPQLIRREGTAEDPLGEGAVDKAVAQFAVRCPNVLQHRAGEIYCLGGWRNAEILRRDRKQLSSQALFGNHSRLL